MPHPMKTNATSAWTATVMAKAATASAHSIQSFIPSLVSR